MGSVNNIEMGLKSVTTRRNLIAAIPVGPVCGGGGIPSFLARFCRMIFLYVSFIGKA